MLDEDVASKAIGYALELGASYADVRVEYRESRGFLLENGSIEHTASSIDHGLSIRVIVDGAWGFYAVAEPNREDVSDAVDKAVRLAKGSSDRVKERVILADTKAYRDRVEFGFKVDSRVEFARLIDYAKEYDSIIRRREGIYKSTINAGYDYVEKLFMSSEGASIIQSYMDTVMSMSATAYEQGLTESVSRVEGGRGGLELLNHEYMSRVAEDIADKAVRLLKAKPVKEDKAVVVMDPDFVALLTHEILGHPSEADRVLGYEMAWAGGAWWRNMLGKRIGSDLLNVSDDPTIPYSLGHYKYDDEGVIAREKVLVKDGILVNHMHSRATAYILGTEPNAGMRATGYEYMPLIRMACTYIKPLDWSVDEIIKDVNDGYIVYGQKVPSIDMYRYNWSISCQYAYKIENGEVREDRMCRDVIVMGNAPEFFASIDACSKQYEIRPILNCGKGDPMQTLRMGNGGPYVRGVATVKSIA